MHCILCAIRIPKNRPLLNCSICDTHKCHKCNKLSKTEAFAIAKNSRRDWTCMQCITDILPINACNTSNRRNKKSVATDTCSNSTKNTINLILCTVCSKQCSPKQNILQCNWCNNPCCKKCYKKSLGCKSCCLELIPGYEFSNFELTNSFPKNTGLYNPYDQHLLINQLGDELDTLEENKLWADISSKLTKCNYKQLSDIPKTKNNDLRIMSLNIRSLCKHIHLIREDISHFQKFDILSFNEACCNPDRLPNGTDDLLIEGFHPPIIQAPHRKSLKGGGLAIYVSTRICEQQDIKIIDILGDNEIHSFENIFVNIVTNNLASKKSYIIGNIYRSPSSKISAFLDEFEQLLTKLNKHNHKHIILAGDFNIDIKNFNTDPNCQNLINLTSSNGFSQIISSPTRITDHSATLIDHIYTNQIHNTSSSGVLTIDISDHLGTYINICHEVANHHNLHIDDDDDPGTQYHMHDENVSKFSELIQNETWDNMKSQNDTQSKYDAFIDTFTNHYDSAFTSTKPNRRKKQRKNPKPWLLPWLQEACDRKNRLYHSFVKDPSPTNKTKYLKMKKFVRKHIQKAKQKYYAKYFALHKENSRKKWQMINSLLNRNKRKSTTIKLQDAYGQTITSQTAVAEKFNEYFCEIASNLKPDTQSQSSHEHFLNNPCKNSIYLSPTDPTEVSDTIKSLKLKATSDTKIDALKAANHIPTFTKILTEIINLSFEQGTCPTQFKTAKVIPIHKNGSKKDVSNYRPISLLSSFSKIFEKLMHSRISNFLNVNQSLHEMQYGFRSGRSCEHALLMAQHEILSSLNNKQISLLLLVDFSKAFDMVDHDILLSKLKHYGIRGTAHQWLASYLSDRMQYVSVKNKLSSTSKLKYGVPQGSILGPLLFIIYINDIPNISTIAKFILYADDANIIITGDNIAEIESKFKDLSEALSTWVSSNGLLLNSKKTNYMIFAKNKNNSFDKFIPKLNNIPIARKNVARFLGVLVDDRLSWSNHIAAIKSKMSKYIGILYKLKGILPQKARETIFHSFVQSQLNYCSLIWGTSAKSHIESLFVTQKKAMRALMPGFTISHFTNENGTTPTHTKPAFTSFSILTVQNIILKNILVFMHKINKCPSLLPPSISQTISHDAPTPGSTHETCSQWLRIYGSNSYSKSLFFKGPLFYSDMSSEIYDPTISTSNRPLNYHKNVIKSHLFELQKKGDTENWISDNFKLYNSPGLRKSARTRNTVKLNTPNIKFNCLTAILD